MSFATVVNCSDGRVQIPVLNHLLDRFAAAGIPEEKTFVDPCILGVGRPGGPECTSTTC